MLKNLEKDACFHVQGHLNFCKCATRYQAYTVTLAFYLNPGLYVSAVYREFTAKTLRQHPQSHARQHLGIAPWPMFCTA